MCALVIHYKIGWTSLFVAVFSHWAKTTTNTHTRMRFNEISYDRFSRMYFMTLESNTLTCSHTCVASLFFYRILFSPVLFRLLLCVLPVSVHHFIRLLKRLKGLCTSLVCSFFMLLVEFFHVCACVYVEREREIYRKWSYVSISNNLYMHFVSTYFYTHTCENYNIITKRRY